ncbi:MAG TPA: DUF3592 domain-containing protein [Herpetosiphonaceae bacterium]|nr:DUF3592 domain-containing protein [Herpetosiphonaceae bacterium]
MRYIVGAMMVVFLLGGLGLIRLSAGLAWKVFQRRRLLVRTVGIVLRVERKVSMGGNPGGGRRGNNIRHFPVVSFEGPDGRRISFQSTVGDMGRTSRYRTGQPIKVRYDPAGKIAPVVDGWGAIWFEPLIFAFAGLAFVGGAAMIWLAFGDRILGR